MHRSNRTPDWQPATSEMTKIRVHRKVGNGRAVPDELGSQAWCTVVTRRQKESPGRETIYIDGHRGGLIVSKRGKASPPTLPTIGRLLGLATTPVFRETYADQLSEFVSDAAGGRPAILIITAPGNEVFIVRHTHTNTHTPVSPPSAISLATRNGTTELRDLSLDLLYAVVQRSRGCKRREAG